MSGKALDTAFWNYDRTRLLRDGQVRIDEVEARFQSARVVPVVVPHKSGPP